MPAERKPTPPVYSAGQVRQGEIILKTRTQRLIFIGGLAGMLLIGLISLFVR